LIFFSLFPSPYIFDPGNGFPRDISSNLLSSPSSAIVPRNKPFTNSGKAPNLSFGITKKSVPSFPPLPPFPGTKRQKIYLSSPPPPPLFFFLREICAVCSYPFFFFLPTADYLFGDWTDSCRFWDNGLPLFFFPPYPFPSERRVADIYPFKYESLEVPPPSALRRYCLRLSRTVASRPSNSLPLFPRRKRKDNIFLLFPPCQRMACEGFLAGFIRIPSELSFPPRRFYQTWSLPPFFFFSGDLRKSSL